MSVLAGLQLARQGFRSVPLFNTSHGFNGVVPVQDLLTALRFGAEAGGKRAMTDVVIVSAGRTPVGSFNGAFGGVTADYLGTVAIKRGRTPMTRGLAALAAIVVFVYIMGTAMTKDPWFFLPL